MSKHSNVKIIVDNKEIERCLRKFKRMCEYFGVYREYRDRKEYKKPSLRKKEKEAASKKRIQQSVKDNRNR